MKLLLVLLLIAAVVAALAWRARLRKRRGPGKVLITGSSLPLFTAETEDGNPLRSDTLLGKPAVLIFLRGSWCPFCNEQVRNLTQYYRRINELGAALIFVTARPLDTTRRVADVFGVDFTFWLDRDLRIARALEILSPKGVPAELIKKFGVDTVWPTAVIVDANGKVRYVNQSSDVRARPDPRILVAELEKL